LRVPGSHSAGEDRVSGVEPVVGTATDDDRPPRDEVVVDLGERMVDEQTGQLVGVSGGAGHVWHGSVAGAMADDRTVSDTDAPDVQLARYRASIDNIDAALVHLLAERFKITQDVGRYKAEVGLPAADPAREELQVARLRTLAVESGLDPVFSEKFLRFIVAEVIHHHQQHAEQPVAD
jgi:chorismate mutase